MVWCCHKLLLDGSRFWLTSKRKVNFFDFTRTQVTFCVRGITVLTDGLFLDFALTIFLSKLPAHAHIANHTSYETGLAFSTRAFVRETRAHSNGERVFFALAFQGAVSINFGCTDASIGNLRTLFAITSAAVALGILRATGPQSACYGPTTIILA